MTCPRVTKKDCKETTLKRINSIQKEIRKAKREFNKNNIAETANSMHEIISEARSALNWMFDLL